MHTLEQLKAYEKQFQENGFFVLDLNDPALVEKAAESLEKHLQTITKNDKINLSNYHHFFENDEEHYQTQFEMLQFFRQQNMAQEIILSNMDVYQFILGPDLDIQTEPYLRITRPHKNKDNIGYHRDTFYGTGPGEIFYGYSFHRPNRAKHTERHA